MPPPIDTPLFCPVRQALMVRSHRKLHVGPLVLEIRSNERDFVAMRYFSPGSEAEAEAKPNYILNFCNLHVDAPWPVQTLLKRRDETYRGGRFAAGYYITDHFGPPAYLITQGTHYWIFGESFETIFWPYFVKLLLTLYSMDRGILHLKAAAVAVEGVGSLLTARGGGGKTVLLARLCEKGAEFISNTHSLINADTLIGVPAAMRVRNDQLFAPIIGSRPLSPGIKVGEYLADPISDLGWRCRSAASLKNICLVDYRGTATREIREIDPDVLFSYMESFSLPINVYGLKEDLLDHLGGDVSAFAAQIDLMKSRLRAIVQQCAGYYVSCDATDPRNLDAVYRLLGAETS